MIVDARKCLCDSCMRHGYCTPQRTVINLQKVACALNPTSMMVAIRITMCDDFIPVDYDEVQDGDLVDDSDTTTAG